MKTIGEIIPDCIGSPWQMVNRFHACRRKTQCVIKKANRCPCCDHSADFKRHTIRAERRWSKQVIREQLNEVDELEQYLAFWKQLTPLKILLDPWFKKMELERNTQ
jgi:hypothetical protein